MDKIHAVSIKTDTVEECKLAFPGKAEEIFCRGGGKMDKKKQAQVQDVLGKK